MKINLTINDTLQLSKAIKGGVLDTGKVDFLKTLVSCYNPHRQISKEETAYYLECLERKWGLYLNSQEEVMKAFEETAKKSDELYNKWISQIESGELYRELIKGIFWGVIYLSACGYGIAEGGGDPNYNCELSKKPEWAPDW